MALSDFFKATTFKVVGAAFLALIFLIFGSPVNNLLRNGLESGTTTIISFVILSLIFNVLLAYLLICFVVFDYVILKNRILELKKMTDVFSIRGNKVPIIIASSISLPIVGFIILNEFYMHFSFVEKISDYIDGGTFFAILFFVICIVIIISLRKKDFLLERSIWVSFIYLILVALLLNISYAIDLIQSQNVYFLENFLGNLGFTCIMIGVGCVLAFILSALIEVFRNIKDIWNRKVLLFHALIFVYFLIWAISKMNYM
jgi:hypothetical protein